MSADSAAEQTQLLYGIKAAVTKQESWRPDSILIVTGVTPNEQFQPRFFSPGMHYLVTPNLERGVRVGWGLTEQSARFFSNVGFGWRF